MKADRFLIFCVTIFCMIFLNPVLSLVPLESEGLNNYGKFAMS